MTIQEMHSTFRVLANQAGMQLVRGILPEHIDAYINAVIAEKVQQELISGVRTVYQETVNTQPSTINPINLFRTLYKTVRLNLNGEDVVVTQTETDDKNTYITTSYIQTLSTTIPTVNENGYTFIPLTSITDAMMYLGFSLEYDNMSKGRATACRLIGADVLETTLRDFCNGASKDSPIVTMGYGENGEQIEIYTGTKNQPISVINVKYIKNPNIVKFDLTSSECVNCDLPSYCHYEIVERAVQKYLISMGALTSKKQNNN